VVCAVDALDAVDAVDAVEEAVDALDTDDAVLEEYEVAACWISSSSSVEADFVVDEPAVAAVAVVLGACAANQAPRPRKDAALTAPVIRRARRAGWGFFDEVMVRACARAGKST